jgi:hypothetical protein
VKLTDQELRDTMVEPFAVGDDKDVADAMKALARELLAARKVVEAARPFGRVCVGGDSCVRAMYECDHGALCDNCVLSDTLAEHDKAVKP